MALKDWKKIRDEYHEVKYINKYEDEKEITIEPSGYGDWFVSWLLPNNSFIKLSKRKYKRFNIKSHALKFAKQWMKDN